VTRLVPGGYATVAATSELALAVDEAQYAEGSGPCLQAITHARVTEVSDISATMAWPGFRETALELGLRASLSIPLFAGRGSPVAALNLYSRQPSKMRPLSIAVESVFVLEEPGRPAVEHQLDDGAKNLTAGLTGAFAVRAVIQQAIGVIMALTAYGPDQAYEALCVQAAETDAALTQAAARVISGQRW
jgi:GAF domain/ANTAR domain